MSKGQEHNKERKLKIQPKSFPRGFQYVTFPEIRVAGKWLQDLGFTCGRYVTIVQQENSLIITLLPEAKPQQLPEQKETNPYRMLRKQTKDNANDDRIFVFNRSSDPPGYVSPAEKSLCQVAEKRP
jgi:toxic protein SymE